MRINAHTRLSSSPRLSREEREDRENLKTAGQHIQHQHDLGKITVRGEGLRCANALEARTDVIEASEVAAKASFIEEFSTEYYNCVVKATIDKETGRMVKTNYTTPLVLKVRINMFGTHEASLGFTFEKDYTITY